MRETRLIMGMPVTVEIDDDGVSRDALERVFAYFVSIDERFSTYKPDSEITRINEGRIAAEEYSADMKIVLRLSEETKQATDGYFDIMHDGVCDPSGMVKGWAIHEAAKLVQGMGFRYFFIDAGGDVQVSETKRDGRLWEIGIRNPFNEREVVKVIAVGDKGVATSGTYSRGQHIYNPHDHKPIADIVSFTVIGPNIYEADRFATAAFAMGGEGIDFIEKRSGLEGYMIDRQGTATYTSGFAKYVRTK